MSDNHQTSVSNVSLLPLAVQGILATRTKVYVYYDVRKALDPKFKVYTKRPDIHFADLMPKQFLLVGCYKRIGFDPKILMEDAQLVEKEYALAPLKFMPANRGGEK